MKCGKFLSVFETLRVEFRTHFETVPHLRRHFLLIKVLPILELWAMAQGIPWRHADGQMQPLCLGWPSVCGCLLCQVWFWRLLMIREFCVCWKRLSMAQVFHASKCGIHCFWIFPYRNAIPLSCDYWDHMAWQRWLSKFKFPMFHAVINPSVVKDRVRGSPVSFSDSFRKPAVSSWLLGVQNSDIKRCGVFLTFCRLTKKALRRWRSKEHLTKEKDFILQRINDPSEERSELWYQPVPPGFTNCC